jgi:hypothetical protein
VLPNGDVLVTETAAPERESSRKGIKGAIMAKAQNGGVGSAERRSHHVAARLQS